MSGCGRLTTRIIAIMLLEMPFLPSFSFRAGTYPYGHKRAPLATQLAASNWRFLTIWAFTGPFMLVRPSLNVLFVHLPHYPETQSCIRWCSHGFQLGGEVWHSKSKLDLIVRERHQENSVWCVRRPAVKAIFTSGEHSGPMFCLIWQLADPYQIINHTESIIGCQLSVTA